MPINPSESKQVLEQTVGEPLPKGSFLTGSAPEMDPEPDSMSRSLLRIAQRLNSTLESETLLDVLIQEAMAFIGAQSGCSGIYTRQGMVSHKYFQDNCVLPLEYCWPANHGLPGWLIVHKVPYLTNDALADPQIVHELCLQFGVRSALSTPILDAQGDLLGFFELHNKRGGSGFTSSDQHALLALSHLASIALQNALAFERLHRTEQALRQARDALEFQVAQRTAALAHTNEALKTEIIERKQAEEHLLQTQQHLQSVLNHAPLVLWSVDRQGLYTLSEGKGLEALGLRPGEVVGQSHVLHFSVPSAQEDQDPQGKIFYLDGTPITDKDWALGRALTKGEVVIGEERLYVRRDGTSCYLRISAAPVKDSQGNIIAGVLSFYDITEQKELEQRKDEFISMAGHELKTPITSLKGFTQVLLPRFKTCDDEEFLRLLACMDGQINQLTRLVNDLLDVSKMRTGRLEFRKESFDLDGLVQEIVENVQRTTPTHCLVLAKQVHVCVVGDRERIGQVLINLLTNAIKYSPQADRVLIRMAQDEQNVIVSVQDFGVGIAQAHQHKIFDRYYQVSNSGKRPFSGLGLGLYLAHEIIKAHDGSLLLESEEGKGSTFSFTLPVLGQEAE